MGIYRVLRNSVVEADKLVCGRLAGPSKIHISHQRVPRWRYRTFVCDPNVMLPLIAVHRHIFQSFALFEFAPRFVAN